jgi:hypothetical protein
MVMFIFEAEINSPVFTGFPDLKFIYGMGTIQNRFLFLLRNGRSDQMHFIFQK